MLANRDTDPNQKKILSLRFKMVQNTGLKPFSARKQAVIHQGKSRGFILKLVKNTREKLVLPRKIFARELP